MARKLIECIVPVLRNGKHYLTSGYGERTVNGNKGFHKGCDFVGGTDSRAATDHIVAYESGVITKATGDVDGTTPSEGNAVYINHGNGIETCYFHLKKGSVTVKKDDLVARGDVIGYMGNTGNSTGAHLHFGIRINGEWTDPLPYLEGTADLGFKRNSQKIKTLRRGDKGADVSVLQHLLNSTIKAELEVDGSYGAKTESAVKNYQKASGLEVDGVFGGNSWAHILRSEKQ